ncbi:hypothetical protein H7U18_15085 [Klebsiella pneumoniae]|uniref:Trimethylamine-N-oxide reductase n=1 Tax=Klebsiella pneumoniae TaxID=573 RepID=A0A923J9R6_KLEPN|nr:hypothetical protein [Klebsiella pneumoniae]
MPTSSATKTILTAAHWGPMLVETDGENVLSSRGAGDTVCQLAANGSARSGAQQNPRALSNGA